MFRRFGAEVTIIEKGPRLVGHEDEETSDAIREILAKGGHRHPPPYGVRVASASPRRTSTRVSPVESGERRGRSGPHVGSHVLTWRSVGGPNTGTWGSKPRRAWPSIHAGYITVDDHLSDECARHLGDGRLQRAAERCTHTAYNDFEIIAANLLDRDASGHNSSMSDRIFALGLYVDPPLGRSGSHRAQLRPRGRTDAAGGQAADDARAGRAVERGETQGFMKVVVDAETHKILGAAILGPNGDEAIHGILDMMYAKAPATVIQRAMHIHPTVSELIPTMLGELAPL